MSPGDERHRDREPTLVDVLWVLANARWTIAVVLAAVLVLAVAYLVAATPVYESDALVQVEDKAKTLAGLQDLSAMFAEASPAETEIEIIRSRSLIGSVVNQLDLDFGAAPRRFPLIGSAMARRHRDAAPADPFLGLSRFAWGGERIRVRRLDVANELLERELTLTALPGGQYRLDDDEGGLLVEASVGVAAGSTEGRPHVGLFVSELNARPGTEFRLVKHRAADVIRQLQLDLRIAEKGKKTGILVLGLEGEDPARTAATLSAIATTYLRQNVERKSAEAAKTLEFLESQLPVLKSNLDAAEAALNAYRRGKGTIDLSLETQKILERAADIEKALSELDLARSELRQRFTDSHPTILGVAKKMETLREERAATSARMRALPETELESARLVRDVKVATELYLLLLNKAQELRVVKSGTVGNVRIVDQATVPYLPARPKRGVVLFVALLFGLGAGIAVALGKRALLGGAEDPSEIEAGTGLPVYVVIPHSEAERRLHREHRRAPGVPVPVLAVAAPDDLAVESLRSLRTSLQFALVEARNHIVAISGPGPETGKSFVALNLAHVLVSADRKVLLVDADLRRGRVHRHFGLERQPGVSDVVSGAATFDAAIRPTGNGHLYVLPSGRIPPNPAELLASNRFELMLGEAALRFDLVIIDTPPLLAVTDPVLVARIAGVNLLVLRGGGHSISEIAQAAKVLEQNGVKAQGAVLNDVRAAHGRYGRYGRYYRYQYASPSSG